MGNRILICGNRSFVAKNFEEKLIDKGFSVDGFTRGAEARNLNQVTGNVIDINKNLYLLNEYDYLVNFIVLKDEGVEENISFIKSIVELCLVKKVKRLIHFSSIMVYDNNEPFVNEDTPIEKKTSKVGYGEVKIAVDNYLNSLIKMPFLISIIRPGYVLTNNRPCPFLKSMPFGISIIKGDRKSVQPIVNRDTIHEALINMIQVNSNEPVYLFVPSKEMTKYIYVKENIGGFVITMPKILVLGIANVLLSLKIINPSLFVRIEGMYIESKYNSSKTEKVLNIKF